MPSLRDLQTRFMRALTADSPDAAIPLIAAPPADAAIRFQVYRNTVQATFERALRASFPVIERLVGADYFRRSARGYQQTHPSESGDLRHIGSSFAAYLDSLHSHDEFAYLAEIARLEWLIQESLLSADHAALDRASLAQLAPDSYPALQVELHPALRLFESRYPALRIWQQHRTTAEPETIDLRSGGDRLAIMRVDLQMKFHRLSVGEYGCLGALARDEVLSSALARGVDCDLEFDASAAVQRYVAAQVIVGFRLPAIFPHALDGSL